MSCLACYVLEGRIQPPGGVIYEDQSGSSKWACSDKEAEDAVEAIRRAWR